MLGFRSASAASAKAVLLFLCYRICTRSRWIFVAVSLLSAVTTIHSTSDVDVENPGPPCGANLVPGPSSCELPVVPGPSSCELPVVPGPTCESELRPTVIPLSDIPQDSYGRSGLSHMTIAGAVHHGMKEIEVWMQTFAPGCGTPIHRHECEEVFIVLRGSGTLWLADEPGPANDASSGASNDPSSGSSNDPLDTGKNKPSGINQHHFCSNSTFSVPVNAVHQVTNSHKEDDLQLLVIISRPPIKIFVYPTWHTPHVESRLMVPYTWDKVCPSTLKARTGENQEEISDNQGDSGDGDGDERVTLIERPVARCNEL